MPTYKQQLKQKVSYTQSFFFPPNFKLLKELKLLLPEFKVFYSLDPNSFP